MGAQFALNKSSLLRMCVFIHYLVSNRIAKKLVILTLLSLQLAYAQEIKFSLERSTPSGLDKIELQLLDKKINITKNSNWFDKNLDYRLGRFTTQENKVTQKLRGELKKILEDLAGAEKTLQANKTSFNELNSHDKPHAPYYKINNFMITSDSILYEKLQKLSETMKDLPWKLTEGIRLDEKKEHYVFIKDSKESKKEIFNQRFFCDSTELPTRCMAREWGTLYLE
jgi:chaperonin cofactor prefoldin